MRNSFEEWCETADFSLEEIDRRANERLMNHQDTDLVYLSLDLYSILLNSFATKQRYGAGAANPPSIVNIHTSAGQVHINKVAKLRNFCLVGTKDDYDTFIANGVDPIFWNDQERVRINKEFEDIVLGVND